jgi:hypothetical protein
VKLRHEFLVDAVSLQGVTYAPSDVDVVPLGHGITALIPTDVNVDSVDVSVSAKGVQATSNFRVDGSIGASNPAAAGLPTLASGQFVIVMNDWGKGTFTWEVGQFPDGDPTADYYGYTRRGLSEPIHSVNHPDLFPYTMSISQTAVVPLFNWNILPWSSFSPSTTTSGNCSSPTHTQISFGVVTLSKDFTNCSQNVPSSGAGPGDYNLQWVPSGYESPGMFDMAYVDGVKVKQGTTPYFSFGQTIGFTWPYHSPASRSCYLNGVAGRGGTWTC